MSINWREPIMKIRTLMVLLAAVFVLAASPAPAQIRPGSVSITPFFGGYTFDSDLNLDTNRCMD
jgi:OOP family OmpA-OmpF porin